ncbi:MAG: AAA domain-containing protein, partial [Thermodesulfobacteriota bacterium]|nr:AAA domain-containing protein [Thermodesulfobacteriota bacterium]
AKGHVLLRALESAASGRAFVQAAVAAFLGTGLATQFGALDLPTLVAEGNTVRFLLAFAAVGIRGFSKEDGQKDREICYAAFQASRFSKDKNSVLLMKDTEDEVALFNEFLIKQAAGMDLLCEQRNMEKTGISCVGVDLIPYTDSKKLAVLAANLIVAKNELVRQIEPYLPPDISLDVRTVQQLFSDEFIRRMRASTARTQENKSWEGEIAWRISRMHELKNIRDRYDSLSLDVDMLIPHFERNGSKKNKTRFEVVRGEIDKIRRIALPSVLELLQDGFETSFDGRGHNLIALYSGLSYAGNDPSVLEMRHTLLTHQHRMHPDISDLPRRIVYEGKALNNANGDEGMKREREWDYNKYSSRCVWIDLKPNGEDLEGGKSKSNLAEVRAVKKALLDFMDWAKDNPNNKDRNGNWSVAVLTFYNGQKKKLKEKLADILGESGISSEFIRKDCNVTVKISSVDRFQGHEADVVFLSFVQYCHIRNKKRCSKSSIGFLNFQNRLNVAVTRARYQLVMFGDKQNFKATNAEFLKALATESTPGDIEFGGV